MRKYTPCDKHDLIGCVTCNWKRQLPYVTTLPGPLLSDLDESPISCAFCDDELGRGDTVTRYQGRWVHTYCLTDVGEPKFHTFANASTQVSQHDVDKWEPSNWPTVADRGWEREDTE